MLLVVVAQIVCANQILLAHDHILVIATQVDDDLTQMYPTVIQVDDLAQWAIVIQVDDDSTPV